MIGTTDTETDKYLVQTRSQAKSSGVKVPEVHSADKGLIPHIKPECQKSVVAPTTCPTPPTCHTKPMYQTQTIEQGPPTNIMPSVPKPRIGQGKTGIRRKPRITPPIPRAIQTPAPPIPYPAPRAAQPLPESVAQLQERTIPWHHMPVEPPPLVHPTPASITQPIEPRIEHRPIPPYHEPFLRPPPRPPHATGVKDNRKGLLDLDR